MAKIEPIISKPMSFYAVRKLSRAGESDQHPPYQIEKVLIQGTKVLKRELYDKPDTKEMVMSKIDLLLEEFAETEHETSTLAM